MVQTQSLTMLGYVGSSCADNRLASSFTVWHQIFSFNIFRAIQTPFWAIMLHDEAFFLQNIWQYGKIPTFVLETNRLGNG